MKIIWTELALLDAENIKAYIEQDSEIYWHAISPEFRQVIKRKYEVLKAKKYPGDSLLVDVRS